MVPYQSVEYLAKKLRDKDGNNKMNYIIEQIILPWYHKKGI